MRYIALLLLATCSSWLAAQTFPANGDVFVQDEVTRIEVTMDATDFQTMYASNSSATTYPGDVVFYHSNYTDTLLNVGVRLRGNTSLEAQKKYIKLDLNEYENLELKQLEKLNINSEKNDPTLLRSRLSLEMYRAAGVMASRVAHTELYINGNYFGLYSNVEHLDEEFIQRRFEGSEGNLYKCLYPATLQDVGPDGDDYKFEEFGRRVYELRTNRDADDYSDLANFINVLNDTPDANFECAIEEVFDVDAFLRTMAIDALIGNWDGYAYNKNNFYLYHDVNTGRFIYIPYDLDNTWGIDWVSRDWGTRDVNDWGRHNDPRPLYNRIMGVTRYKERYNFYLEHFMATFFTETAVHDRIDALKALTSPSVTYDPLRALDFNWSLNDYENSFTQPLPPHVDYGLKMFVTTRLNSATAQLNAYDIVPYLYGVEVGDFLEGQQASVLMSVTEDNALTDAKLYYRVDGGAWQSVSLADDGLQGDGVANDGRYGGALPALSVVGQVEYYLTATDDAGQQGRYPWCGSLVRMVAPSNTDIYINELMADNDNTLQDEASEYDDWVELYNASGSTVDLGGLYLTDNPADTFKWELPALQLSADSYVVIWADDDEDQGDLHTNFRLSADGESVTLYSNAGALLDQVTFGPQATDVSFARIPNGTGAFQAVTQPTPGSSNVAPTSVTSLDVTRMQLGPNPTADIATVSVQLATAQSYSWQLVDVSGRILTQASSQYGREIVAELDLSAYASGTYWWVLLVDGQPQLLRAVVKR